MENKFIPDAIEIISKAIEADNAGEYEKALNFYRDALGRFTIGLKYEKNDARRKLVMERVDGYMKRAEELRDYINAQHELDKNGGKGGSATKSRDDKDGEDDDAEKKKLRGALQGAIITEKPNVKWSDVAGLDAAKDSLREVSLSSLYQLVIAVIENGYANHVSYLFLPDRHHADQVPAALYWESKTLQRNSALRPSRYRVSLCNISTSNVAFIRRVHSCIATHRPFNFTENHT